MMSPVILSKSAKTSSSISTVTLMEENQVTVRINTIQNSFESITMNAGVIQAGRALALNGAVTMENPMISESSTAADGGFGMSFS